MKFKKEDKMQRSSPPIITTSNFVHISDNRDNELCNQPYYFEELSIEDANNILKTIKKVYIFQLQKGVWMNPKYINN